MGLINRGKLMFDYLQRLGTKDTYKAKYEALEAAVDNAPTLDAVPVIRCAACAWRSATGFCSRHGHPVCDDFFCAHGTTEITRKPGPAKKTEKKAEERCLATGGLCSKCTPGPCDHRRVTNE